MGPTSSIKSILLSTLCVAASGAGVLAHPTPEAPPAPSTTHTITPPSLDLLLDPEIRKTHEFTVPCGCWTQCTLLNVAAGGKLLAPDNTWSIGNDTKSLFPTCDPGWCIPEYMCRDDGTTPLPDDDVPQEPNILLEGDVNGGLLQDPKADGDDRRSLRTAKIDKRGCLWIICCEYLPSRPDTDDNGGSIACTIDIDRWDELF